MKESWLLELERPDAHEVANKLNEIHDRVKDVPGYQDQVWKLHDLIAAESPQAVQWAQAILLRMAAEGHDAEWARQALAFLKQRVPEKYLMLEEPPQKEELPQKE